ncbi:MAG: hypothetical protein ACRYFS_24560 [Janthinobacterium lividum]
MITALYSDGGCIGPNPSLDGGTWAWCAVDEDGERILSASGVLLPFQKDADCNLIAVTNNQSEMVALTRGLLSLPDGWSGTVFCDSRLALGWTFWNFKHDLVPNRLYLKAMEAKARLGRIETVLLDGHPTQAQLAAGFGKRGQPVSEHNKFVDALCTDRAKEFKLAREYEK